MAVSRACPTFPRAGLIHVALVSEFPTDGAEPRGGVEASVDRLASALVDAGLTTTIVAPTPPGVHVVRRADGAPTIIGAPHDPRLSLATRLRDWRRAVGRALEALEPDVVHGHGILVGGLAAVDDRRSPSVVTAHGNARADTLAANRSLASVARAALQRNLSRSVVRRANAVIGVHPDWRVNLPARPRVFRFVPNIVSEPFFAARRDPVPGRVLFCGGTRRIKGGDLLLAAWPSVREAVDHARLACVGWSGGDPGVDGIVLRESVGPTELAEELARAQVLVVPSRFEVAPLVVGEAWAVGTPVISTDRGGLPGLVEGAGVVTAADPAEIARALVKVLREPGSVDELVREGRRRVEQNRATEVAAAHRSLYDELLAGT